MTDLRTTTEGPVDTAGGLIEREAELSACFASVDEALAGDGVCLVVAGEAGAGKTSILDATIELAADRGLRVLRARAGELERHLPFGVVRQLFERHVHGLDDAQRAELLAGAAGLAAPVLGYAAPAAAGRALDAVFSAVHGLYWLTADLAEDCPTMLAIDDLHWADEPSLRWIAYAARRLEGLPVMLLTATREDEPGASNEILSALVSDERTAIVRPAPLALDGVSTIVRQSRPAASDAFCAACCRVTTGNPFYLGELLVAVQDAEIPSTDTGAAQLDGLGPAGVAERLLARVAQLGDQGVQLARALAVLESAATVERSARLAELSVDEAASLLDGLVAARVLSADGTFGFVHPVVRSAIYAATPPGQRVRLHTRAFEALAEVAASDEQRARHLLYVGPSGRADVVETLSAAAASAQLRGAPVLAARYLRRALEETPAAPDEADLRRDLGLALLADRDRDAFAQLHAAIELASDPSRRDQWALELTRAASVAALPVQAIELASKALERGVSDPAIEIRLESELIVSAWLLAEFVGEAHERLDRLEQMSLPPEFEPFVAVHRAVRMTNLALPGSPVAELEKGIEGGLLLEQNSAVPFVMLIALIWNDDLERPAQLCRMAMDMAQSMGSRHLMANAATFGGLAALRAGAISEAVSLADTGYEIARQSPASEAFNWAWMLSILLDAMRERGQAPLADELLQAAGGAGELPPSAHCTWLLESRGRLRYAQGRLDEATRDLLEAGRRWEHFRVLNPTVTRWRSDAALALMHSDESDRAEALAAEELDLARGAGLDSAIGIALRVCGTVKRDPAMLEQASDTLAQTPLRLEHAKALLELGAAIRRSGRRREARAPLLQALEIATRCGASDVRGRVRDELAVLGARPRRDHLTGVEALTPSELRVAQLAAAGKTNREISQALFLTLRTVETHLTQTYRKLGISSRAKLALAMDPAQEEVAQ